MTDEPQPILTEERKERIRAGFLPILHHKMLSDLYKEVFSRDAFNALIDDAKAELMPHIEGQLQQNDGEEWLYKLLNGRDFDREQYLSEILAIFDNLKDTDD